ncbi:hypothetical protein OUZ56_016799 [Daphnia magna]|uniref:Uncharacterized protein n=1 Tax=Daphnia magna TaxID=35525 RepID=A0ABR0ARL4_9CRUS|nr:hypothetical protein OUZ56_016799 [Daphnia magna]
MSRLSSVTKGQLNIVLLVELTAIMRGHLLPGPPLSSLHSYKNRIPAVLAPVAIGEFSESGLRPEYVSVIRRQKRRRNCYNYEEERKMHEAAAVAALISSMQDIREKAPVFMFADLPLCPVVAVGPFITHNPPVSAKPHGIPDSQRRGCENFQQYTTISKIIFLLPHGLDTVSIVFDDLE